MEPQSQSGSNNLKTGVLVILVLMALVLGYFLYLKMGGSSLLGSISNTNPPALTSDELAVLNPPQEGATQEERDAHFAMVLKVAKTTRELKIGPQCRISPIVLKTTKGTVLTFKNDDSVSHIIAMPNENLSFAVPAEGSIQVPAAFGQQFGTYGYICDGSSLAGIILVEE